MSELLDHLSESVTSARSVEELTRPLLEMLEAVTGLESTYLTSIDEIRGVQHVLYARNSSAMQIPEGLTVPWNDTLCKRALEEGRAFTDDVPACWGDSQAARDLGIRTYVSKPVRMGNGALYGTLCAASTQRRPGVPVQHLGVGQHGLQLGIELVHYRGRRARRGRRVDLPQARHLRAAGAAGSGRRANHHLYERHPDGQCGGQHPDTQRRIEHGAHAACCRMQHHGRGGVARDRTVQYGGDQHHPPGYRRQRRAVQHRAGRSPYPRQRQPSVHRPQHGGGRSAYPISLGARLVVIGRRRSAVDTAADVGPRPLTAPTPAATRFWRKLRDTGVAQLCASTASVKRVEAHSASGRERTVHLGQASNLPCIMRTWPDPG